MLHYGFALLLVGTAALQVACHELRSNRQLIREAEEAEVEEVESLGKLTKFVNRMEDGVGNFTKSMYSMEESVANHINTLNRMDEGVRKLTKTMTRMEKGFGNLTSTMNSLKMNSTKDSLGKLMGKVNSMENRLDILNQTLTELAGGGEEGGAETCVDVREKHPKSGVRTLIVRGRRINVYCDQDTDGGGWTVILRRQNGNTDFYRDWGSYLNGFGYRDDEFWLGLEHMHLISNSRLYTLRVDLWDFEGNTAHALYRIFYIDGADKHYALHLTGYSGSAGDSLARNNNMAFTTYDQDHDKRAGSNCARDHPAGWWHKSCYDANLNGPYHHSAVKGWNGLVWRHWKGEPISLKKAEMKIRPAADVEK